jgi:hypothetical protein
MRATAWRIIGSAVLGAVVAFAVCMGAFRGLHAHWLPQAVGDQWAVAGVFAVVVGGAVTVWWTLRTPEPDAASPGERTVPEPESGPERSTFTFSGTFRAPVQGTGTQHNDSRPVGAPEPAPAPVAGDTPASGDSFGFTGSFHAPVQGRGTQHNRAGGPGDPQ